MTEPDSRPRAEFDILNTFIANHSSDLAAAEIAMKIPYIDNTRMLVAINIPRAEILPLFAGYTPNKLVDFIRHMNVLEMMMGSGKMRPRRASSRATRPVPQPASST